MEANGQIHFLATSQPRKAFGTHSQTEYVWVPALDWTFWRTQNSLALASKPLKNWTFTGNTFHFSIQHIQYDMQMEVFEANRK